jgi:4-alpha-glucanotransferase
MRNNILSSKLHLDFQHRSSGILMHPTSLPGLHGSGDLGPELYSFIDFLADAGQSWWQMLPIGPNGHAPGFSPYDSASAFAGNPWLVSLTELGRQGLLSPDDLKPVRGLSGLQVNFHTMQNFREGRLRKAFTSFNRRRGEKRNDFREFCAANSDWLEDFSLFAALRRDSGGKPWTEWESGACQRQPAALSAARERLSNEIATHRFIQFEFDRQWKALNKYSHQRGIGLIGDLPIFISHDSADVWTHQELFQLDRKGYSRRVSGYPPDRFNQKGQCWGHPQYEWAMHEQTGFNWWVQRFKRVFERFDAVRIDHFLGFTRTWSIPANESGAKSGRWIKSPGIKLFTAVRNELGPVPMIAEDLGHVTAADINLRNMFGLAPMRIFQFGFGSEPDSRDHLPHSYSQFCAAYTGNHDNSTMAGWFSQLDPAQRQSLLSYIGGSSGTIHTYSIRALMASPANLVIFPMQDVLGLGNNARMNIPGSLKGNWRWRLQTLKLDQISNQLGALTQVFYRRVAR